MSLVGWIRTSRNRSRAHAELRAAAALAVAGRHDEAAARWRRAIDLHPVLVPDAAQLAALLPVLPRVAREVLDGLTRGEKGWTLERRGAFDGEERWRLMQDRHDPMEALLPTLRFLATAVAQVADAPGRLRVDCDRPNDDREAYMETLQMGEAVFGWDAHRRITDERVQA
jgi:hypothetical protein